MALHPILAPLSDRIEQLLQAITESSYLGMDVRKILEKEVQEAATKIKEGTLLSPQAEKVIGELEKRTAVEEIRSLIKKISFLNPDSPRLETLRILARQVNEEKIAPEKARLEVTRLMRS